MAIDFRLAILRHSPPFDNDFLTRLAAASLLSPAAVRRVGLAHAILHTKISICCPDIAWTGNAHMSAIDRRVGNGILWLSVALFGVFALLACYHKYHDALHAFFFEKHDATLMDELAAAKIVDEPEPLG